MKKTFLITPANHDAVSAAGTGFFAVPERTVFSYKHVSFWVRR